MTTPIKETGLRGFLLWLKQVQPGIYAKIAPQLPTAIPAGFADYHAGAWRVAGLSGEQAFAKLRQIYGSSNFGGRESQAMADYSLPEIVVTGNYTDATSTPDYSTGISPIEAGPISMAMPSFSIDSSTASAVDTAAAANMGPTSSSILNAVNSLVGTAASAFMTTSQVNNMNKAVQTNLTRAQSGLAPLPLSMYGIPTSSSSSLTGALGVSPGMMIFGLLIGGAYLLLGKKR